jgi:hypothetical protein
MIGPVAKRSFQVTCGEPSIAVPETHNSPVWLVPSRQSRLPLLADRKVDFKQKSALLIENSRNRLVERIFGEKKHLPLL